MKPWLAAALLFPAFSAQAEDGGSRVAFKGLSFADSVEVAAGSAWESGTSDPVSAEFTSVIFHGRASGPGLALEGARKEGDAWGPWASAVVESFPNGRFWGSVALSGRAGDAVRLRIINRAGPGPETVRFYEMETVSPGRETRREKSEPARPAAAPLGDAPKPRVRPRKDWGAEAPDRPYEAMIPVRITVHHTAGARPMTLEDAIQEMQVIQRFHKKGRGWIDIGYHFLIDGAGRVFQGRPEGVLGAHVLNKNEGNVGISLMGSFHKPENQEPNKAQLRGLVALAKWLAAAYSIEPETIKGHRDQMDTACPGDNLYAHLPALRKAVGEPAPPPAPAPTVLRLPAVLEGGALFEFR